MNKTRAILLFFTLLVALASGITAFAQAPAISITSPTSFQTVDTNQLIDVTGNHANLPVDATILIQFRTSPGDVVVGDRSIAQGGTGSWFANDMDFNIGGYVTPGTPGTVIAYARAGDGTIIATATAIDVTWGMQVPTAEPTTAPTFTPTFTPTWTPTLPFTPTATSTPTVTWTPSLTWTPSVTPPAPGTITILSPTQNSIFPTGVVMPVMGTSSNLFANGLTVRALNANNDVLNEASAIQDGAGNWLVNLIVNVPVGTRGSIYAFASRPGDGLVYATSRVNVTYGGQCLVRTDWFTYIVQPGDTLFRIANRVGSTINDLALANCLDNTNLINAGQQLRVPRLPSPPPTANLTSLRILSPIMNAVVDTSARVNVAGSGRGIAGYSVVVRAINQRGEVIGQQVATAGTANAANESTWQAALFIAASAGTPGAFYAYAVAPNSGLTVADDLINVTFGTQVVGTPTPRPSGDPIEGAVEVLINTPVENQTFVLANPIVNGRVIGIAQGSIVLRALDAESNVLAEETGLLTPINENESSWQLTLPFNVPVGTRATIFAYVPDPVSGSIAGSDAVNVVIGESNTSPFITLIDPLPYAIIPLDQSVEITGYGARLFEGNVMVRLLDDEGRVLAERATIVNSPNAGIGGEGEWRVTLDVNVAAGTRGSIYAFATSAQDGSIVTAARRYVTFGDPSTASNFVQITTPLPGTIITPENALLIAGRADLSSGETVTVQIFDEVGNILIEEPRPITPVDDYGTWEVILELQNLQPGTGIRVNAFTTSSFDGSILASDSIGLTYSG